MSDSIKQEIGEHAYESLRSLIRHAFPGPHEAVGDVVVDSVVRQAWAEHTPDRADVLRALGLPEPPREPAYYAQEQELQLTRSHTEGVSYWLANATHDRTVGGAKPGETFVGHLPMVRVRAPQSQRTSINTDIGTVYPGDHKTYTVDEFNDKLPSNLQAERIDLITPVRSGGTRFGAVSAMLAYRRATDPGPSFYLLEAGMATGQPRVIFLGQSMSDVIVAPTNYYPTPFVTRTHYYKGWVEMDAHDPGRLNKIYVQAYTSRPTPESRCYIQITAELQEQQKHTWPAKLIIEAICRVAAVGHSLGMNVPLGPLSPLLAEVGRHHYQWVREPDADYGWRPSDLPPES